MKYYRGVWTSYNILSKLRTLQHFMLRHNSNIALQSIFSTSIPHNDTQIKVSEVSNFNKACKWLLIAFCFENPLSRIAILEGMTSDFCQSFMRCGQLVYHLSMPPQNCHAAHNDLFSHSCLKVSTNSSNSALLASHSTAINLNFMINLSNHYSNVVIWAPSSLG